MLRSVILQGLCCVLIGCSTSPSGYEIILKDGRTIETREWPHLNGATGYYRCKQKDGSLVQFREGQVTSISANEPR